MAQVYFDYEEKIVPEDFAITDKAELQHAIQAGSTTITKSNNKTQDAEKTIPKNSKEQKLQQLRQRMVKP